MINYYPVEDFPGWEKAENLLRQAVELHHPRTVFEVGSGANPTLCLRDVDHFGLRYITSDCDMAELRKADPVYEARCIDLTEGPIPPDLIGRCDLVFSRMVNEHIHDGSRYHTNIYNMLAPGGVAVHAFSTLYALPFLVNYMMPSRIGEYLYNMFNPRDSHMHSKFDAYYSWSRGPTRNSIARFEQLGYEVVSYNGFFGHLYYKKFPPLVKLERLKTRLLLALKLPLFCAYATVVLRKPIDARDQAVGARAGSVGHETSQSVLAAMDVS